MRHILVAIGLLAAASPASAHSGHSFGFAAGLVHPLSGMDHWAAMALVGLWAAALGGDRARIWSWPATFVGALVAGAFVGRLGVAAPGVETAVAASVVILGGLVMTQPSVSLSLGVAILAPLGFAHGVAHGLEAPDGSFALYVGGFIAATAALHAVGVAAGLSLARGARWIGAASVAAGLYLSLT
jgi:urease accessory protein